MFFCKVLYYSHRWQRPTYNWWSSWYWMELINIQEPTSFSNGKQTSESELILSLFVSLCSMQAGFRLRCNRSAQARDLRACERYERARGLRGTVIPDLRLPACGLNHVLKNWFLWAAKSGSFKLIDTSALLCFHFLISLGSYPFSLYRRWSWRT